jgi:hypothetical protein
MRRLYRIARDSYRFGGLNPRTYIGLFRLWRAERRLMRHGRQLAGMIEVLDRTPQLRRAMRLALRVKGHAAE